MRPHPLFFLAVAALCGLTTHSAARPGSGIVVDKKGNVYFYALK